MKPKLCLPLALFLISLYALGGTADAGIVQPASLYTMPGGQGAGLGGAYTAVADGVYGQRWNPADLALVRHLTLSSAFLYTHDANQNLNYQIGAGPVLNRVTGTHLFGGVVLPPARRTLGTGIGLYFARYELPGVEWRDENGGVEVIDGQGYARRVPNGTFKFSDQTLMLSLAHRGLFYDPILGRFSLGASFALLRQNGAVGRQSSGFTTGFGVIHELSPHFRYGLTLRNLYSRMKGTDGVRDELERELVMGIVRWMQAGRNDSLLVSLDVMKAAGQVWSMNAGMEYRLDVGAEKWLALRGGLGHSFPVTRNDLRIPAIVKGYGRTNPVLGLGYRSRFLNRLFYTLDYSVDIDLDQAISTVGSRHNINISFEIR
ncbi:MAG: hypothetical protein EXS64_20460 [Candidatus Latescibacteria bacterium]|nr:hypothetical protein [Candidatus Latescibacterota bacterium]